MKNRRRITGIVTALLLAIIGTVALVGYVSSAKNKAVAKETLVEVYIVDKLVPKGAEAATIKSSVSLGQVPTRLKQSGAVTDLDSVGTNVAATDLQPGDQLLAARLVPKAKVSEGVTDKVQISALLTAEQAVGGSLEKGDLVGVYLSFDPFELDAAGENSSGAPTTTDPAAALAGTDTTTPVDTTPKKTPNVTRLEFQHVLVTNVQTTEAPVDANTKDTTVVAQVTGAQYVVTLALSPEQSERFVFATEFGHVWLSNDPASVSDDGTRLVTLGNVYRVVK
ncbi:MAG: pilus assembly protein CpaB [Ilumatobacteraceae bacterium]|jgi:pilus assembly protein CpaB